MVIDKRYGIELADVKSLKGFSRVRPNMEEVFIIVVQDSNGKEKEKWTSMKKDFHKVVRILDNKYGLNIWGNKFEQQKERDKDLDWALG